MKRIAILGVFLLLGAATLTQAQDRKAAREARRQQQQQQQQVQNAGNFQTAMQALKDSSFVIEVNQMQGRLCHRQRQLRGFEQEHFDRAACVQQRRAGTQRCGRRDAVGYHFGPENPHRQAW